MLNLMPSAAFQFLKDHPDAVLVDCRAEIEHMYVGHPVGAEHVAWQEAPEWDVAKDFAARVSRLLSNDLNRPVVLICRSGNRSASAGEALEVAGFTNVVNVLEGFEGPLDENFHRGTVGGWRYHGLPWQQS
jgi:rhodanese-related sulfurtransferase